MADPKIPAAVDKLLGAAATPEAGTELAGLVFDFLVDQRVDRFVSPDAVLGHVDRILGEAVTERWLRDHLRPALEREHARAQARDDKVGDWLTAEAQAELRALMARPVTLKKSFLDGLVQQGAVQHMLRSVVEETLHRFLATLKPGGSGGGIVGAVGRGALGMFGSVGKGVFSAVEGELSKAASRFIGGSMNLMMDRLVAILSSPETGAQLGRMRLQGFEEALKAKAHKNTAFVLKLPLDDLLDALPGVIAHNLARPEIRQGLLDEVAAWLAIEGEKPVRALLEEAGAVTALREEAERVGGPLAAELLASPALRAWVKARL